MTDEDLVKNIRGVVREELEPIKDTLDEHTKKLDGITDQLADVSEDVMAIKEKVGLHEKKISEIEDHLRIPTPSE